MPQKFHAKLGASSRDFRKTAIYVNSECSLVVTNTSITHHHHHNTCTIVDSRTDKLPKRPTFWKKRQLHTTTSTTTCCCNSYQSSSGTIGNPGFSCFVERRIRQPKVSGSFAIRSHKDVKVIVVNVLWCFQIVGRSLRFRLRTTTETITRRSLIRSKIMGMSHPKQQQQ